MLRDDEPETSRVDPARGVPRGSEAVDEGHADRDRSGGGRSSSNGTAAKHVIIISNEFCFGGLKICWRVGPLDGDFDKHGFLFAFVLQLFLDDNVRNVAAGRDVGLRTVLVLSLSLFFLKANQGIQSIITRERI